MTLQIGDMVPTGVVTDIRDNGWGALVAERDVTDTILYYDIVRSYGEHEIVMVNNNSACCPACQERVIVAEGDWQYVRLLKNLGKSCD